MPSLKIQKGPEGVYRLRIIGWPPVSGPLNFTARTPNSSVTLNKNGILNTSYKYSLDNTSWSDYTMGTAIPLSNIGDKVYFKGAHAPQSESNYISFAMTGEIDAAGNVNSLLDEEDFADITDLSDYGEYTFYSLFNGCTSLTSAPELPATTLADNCYDSMFRECTSLMSAPELPATTLADYCYFCMFHSCASLTQVHERLPADQLTEGCYYSLFYNCTSLETAPELPATKLAPYCYQSMFNRCTSLTHAPELPTDQLAAYCYRYMFRDCTSLEQAPELPATELVYACYNQMFYGCASLNEVKCYATSIGETSATYDWLSGVSTTGTFYKAAGVAWSGGSSGIPTGWTVIEV